MDDIARLGIEVDSSNIRRADSDLDHLGNTAESVGQKVSTLADRFGDLDNISDTANNAGDEVSTLSDGFGNLAEAVTGISLGLLAKDILDTNREMESLRAALTSTMGSIEAGKQSFRVITEFAKNTPYEVAGLTQNFIMLKNMGINPTVEVMSALTNQASKLGGSQETLSSISLQLGQAYSKGKLQMEDMVILMERGVPVMELLSEVTGRNTSELAEMSSKGEITREVIDQLIIKMGELSEGSNANAMQTLNGSISSLSDAWHQFEDTLLNDKSEGYIRKSVELSTQWLTRLTQGISSDLNDQISVMEEELKSRDFSTIGNIVYKITNPLDSQRDMKGLDVNDRELKRLKALKAQQDAEQNDKEIADKSKAAVIQTNAWIDELETNVKTVDKASNSVKKYSNELKSLNSTLEATAAQLEKQRPENLLSLEQITANPKDASEARRKALVQKNIEFDKANRTGNVEEAARIAQEREKLAFENAREDLYAVRSGELPSYKEFDAKQNYKKAVEASKKSFSRFQSLKGSDATNNALDKNTLNSPLDDLKDSNIKSEVSTQMSQVDKLKQALEDLKKPIDLKINSNISDQITQIEKLKQLSESITKNVKVTTDQTNMGEAISNEALKKGYGRS